jgi:hypothetical protein
MKQACEELHIILSPTCCKICLVCTVSFGLQSVTIDYHMLKGNFMVELRGLPMNICVNTRTNMDIKVNTIDPLDLNLHPLHWQEGTLPTPARHFPILVSISLVF